MEDNLNLLIMEDELIFLIEDNLVFFENLRQLHIYIYQVLDKYIYYQALPVSRCVTCVNWLARPCSTPMCFLKCLDCVQQTLHHSHLDSQENWHQISETSIRF
jgi:hypothetical protein